MKRPLALLLAALPLACALAAPVAAQGFTAAKKANLTLVADRTAYEPGSTLRLAAEVEVEEGWHVNSHTPSYDYLIPTELTLTAPEGFAAAGLTYPADSLQKFAFTETPIAVYDGHFTIAAELVVPADAAAGARTVAARLRYQSCDHQQCLPPTTAVAEVAIVVGPGGQPTSAPPAATATTAAASPAAGGTAPSRSLLAVLLLAVLGGLILNAMPCVLPVLSLKFFGLVKSAGRGRSHLVMGALATAGGILISFWILAGFAVVARYLGAAVGWGVQFQRPGFVTFLAVVVVLFSLNLWGLFEIPLPQRLAQLGGAGAREGLAGHLASGLFATLMATPCSAPFLGTAVGFALAQPPPVIFAIFTAIGCGLALPYFLLAAFPATARLLPRPGDWMVTFKGVMGFLLAAAAVWLFYVLAAQVSSEWLAFIQLAILGLALSAWLFGHAEGRPLGRRLAALGILAAGVLAISLAAQSPAPATAAAHTSAYHRWIAFDESQALLLREEGKLVFVDFTADWCLTCKTNERLVLETPTIGEAFARYQVVTMKGDWTNPDPTIGAFLARYGKSAVPFYLLYRPRQDPYVFGELLTQQQVLDALATTDGAAALARQGR